jgi:hypothetical protein
MGRRWQPSPAAWHSRQPSRKLSNSLQRYHIDSITSAKSADTRQRRIDKAIALFRAGKQR